MRNETVVLRLTVEVYDDELPVRDLCELVRDQVLDVMPVPPEDATFDIVDAEVRR